ncbi:MAG: DDE-type integrase/transposase/recombinase [Candidatus Omnitrophica bacterium]|nr:DDE-type integrase/transposase/recombinase [Candidatus Omnitrophota bacterium]
MRFTPEEKLDIIQLARYSGLGFEKTLNLFGVKPHRVWRWIRNIGDKGLAGLTDQSPVPKSSPSKHLKEEEDLIIGKANAYTHINHRKLAHQIFRDKGVFVSESLVYRILKEHNLIRPRPALKIEAAESWKKKPRSPNEIWHIDISYIPCGLNSNGNVIFWYLVVVLDGYSRFVPAWDLFPDMTKERCFQVVDQALFLAQLPSDKRPKLVSDNGTQFRARKAREFFKELLKIKQIFTSSHHPETNGKIERLFESAKYEALYRNDYCSAAEAKEILLAFFDYYNNHRLHQSLGYRIPREAYYGLNQDYAQKRQTAKSEKLIQRKQYWAKMGDLLTISKS